MDKRRKQFPLTLAGVPVPRDAVEWLVWSVEEPTAALLERALANETRVLALDEADEDRIHGRSRKVLLTHPYKREGCA